MTEASREAKRGKYVLVAVVAVLWMSVFYLMGPRIRPQGSFSGSIMHYPATFDWQVTDLNDKPVGFDTFKGKPIFLNIWATWCGPCIAEMPSIAKLAENPKLKGKVQFLCVATDDSTTPVRRYLDGKGWGMTFLHAKSLPKAYLTEGIPATFAISPDGTIVGLVEGSNDWDNPEVIEFLSELAESSPALKGKKAP